MINVPDSGNVCALENIKQCTLLTRIISAGGHRKQMRASRVDQENHILPILAMHVLTLPTSGLINNESTSFSVESCVHTWGSRYTMTLMVEQKKGEGFTCLSLKIPPPWCLMGTASPPASIRRCAWNYPFQGSKGAFVPGPFKITYLFTCLLFIKVKQTFPAPPFAVEALQSFSWCQGRG